MDDSPTPFQTAAAYTRRAFLLAASATLVGCSAGEKVTHLFSSPTPTPAPVPVATIALEHGLEQAWPSDTVAIEVTDGTVDEVTLTDADGVKVLGKFSGSTFRPTRPFLVNTSYIVWMTLLDADANPHTQSATFTTVNPELVCEVTFRFADRVYGNGMPVWINFDMPVSLDQRAALEKACTVTTSPVQEGSFGWIDEYNLQWRPKTYWEPGSTAHVEVNAAGLPAADTWVLADAACDYTYGDQRVMKINIDTHQLDCYSNGVLINTLPVSLGKPGSETTTGTKLIISKETSTIMDSESYGVDNESADGYRITANWAMRITWSGEYFHAAPWADYAHGNANVSHGCTGLSDANAQWLFNWADVGDPAEYTGSTYPVKPEQTFGCWVYSWEEWQTLSAC